MIKVRYIENPQGRSKQKIGQGKKTKKMKKRKETCVGSHYILLHR